MTDIFLSYSRSDQATARQLAEALTDAGYEVWWDHEVAGGAAFAAEIESALQRAKCVVVAWSIKAIQSEWVVDEASVAKQGGKLVPISLDATPPPIGFRQFQSIDFSTWQGDRNATEFGQLCTSISRYRGRSGQAQSTDLIEDRINTHYADALAVLPLDNLTGQTEQQFFVEGMHEALITELSKIDRLKVISRTSAKRFANSALTVREIAAELGVSKIVEGSVMRSTNIIRVSVQIIDARTDTTIWAESFNSEEEDVLKLQSEIAREIAQRTSAVLTPEDRNRLGPARDVKAEAYQAYLKGMYHWYKLSPEDSQAALQCFDQALAIDPEYALAHTGIAAVWAGVQQMGVMPPTYVAPRIKAAVDRALELDPSLFQAHFSLATYLTWSEWNWPRAEQAFEKAIELNPNFPDTHAFYSHYLNIIGDQDRAQAAIEKALGLDPFNPLVRSLYGVDLCIWGQFDNAINEFLEIRKMMPDHWLPLQALRVAYMRKGMLEQAMETNRELYRLLDKPEVVAAIDAAADSGGFQAAMLAGANELAQVSERSYVAPTQIAMLYAMGGDVENAARWYDKAFDFRDPDLPYLRALYIPAFGLESQPSISRIVEKLDYPAQTG